MKQCLGRIWVAGTLLVQCWLSGALLVWGKRSSTGTQALKGFQGSVSMLALWHSRVFGGVFQCWLSGTGR